MAQLMVFRARSMPTDSEYGDDISVTSAGKSIISENLTEQIISRGKLEYQLSTSFSPGSIQVYLNGIYMTIGEDYTEVDANKIAFTAEHASDFLPDTTILSVRYAAK